MAAKQFLETLRQECISKGFKLGPFRKNKDVWVAQCSATLRLLLVRIDPDGTLVPFGSVLTDPPEEGAVDKNILDGPRA